MEGKAKQTTKDKIMDYLKKEVAMTVYDLTQRLNITDMAVRKHLSILEKDQFIQSKEVKQPMGRPLHIYSISEKGEKLFPKNYEGITVDFLNDVKDIHGEETINSLFSRREQRLTQEYSNRITSKLPSEKMKEIVHLQNEKGYMADGTQLDDHTFELVEYNCPIWAIAKDYKMACKCETSMLKNVLDTDDINRVSCKSDGDAHCKFIITFD